MSPDMQILLDSLRAERDDWLLISQELDEEPASVIAMTAAGVLGGLAMRLERTLETRQTPVWQNMSDLSGAVSSSKTESFPQ